jgi:hypothetical protein
VGFRLRWHTSVFGCTPRRQLLRRKVVDGYRGRHRFGRRQQLRSLPSIDGAGVDRVIDIA